VLNSHVKFKHLLITHWIHSCTITFPCRNTFNYSNY